MKVLGEVRFALSSNFVCMAKLVGFLSLIQIIKNHQLEFSGTRVKYLDHEKRAYKHEVISHIRKKPFNNPSLWRVQRD